MPVVAVFGPQAPLAARVLVLTCGVLALFLAFRLLARATPPVESLCALMLTATSAEFVLTATLVQSELPYLLCVIAALLALEHDRPDRGQIGRALGFSLR